MREEENLAAQELAARQKVSELRSILDSEKSQSSVLRALLEAKESGELPGIFGRLGDLGAIDGNLFNFSVLPFIYVEACSHSSRITAKYDVAISTACAGLDYIVVDTASTAQACVELLRIKNLGVATFLILVMRKFFIAFNIFWAL